MGLLNYLEHLPAEAGGLLGSARHRLAGLLGHPVDDAAAMAPGSVTTPDDGAVMGHFRSRLDIPADVDGSRFGGPAMVAPGTAPSMLAGAPTRRDKSTDGKPGFWQTVDLVLGGDTITDAREKLRQRELDRRTEPAEQALRGQLLEYIATLPAREQAIYFTKPETWASDAGEAMKPRTLSGGSTEIRGDGSTYTAPVLGVNGDQGFTQTPDAFTVTGQRGPSHEETSLDRDRQAKIAQLLTALQETVRHNQASEGIDRSRVAVERQNAATAARNADATVGGGNDLSNMSTADLLAALGQ
jgi:hypothetical protein